MTLRGWIWDLDRWQCGLCGHHHETPIGTPPDVCAGCGQGGYETLGKPKNCKMWQPEMRRRTGVRDADPGDHDERDPWLDAGDPGEP